MRQESLIGYPPRNRVDFLSGEETTAQIKQCGVWRLDRGKSHAGCSKPALLNQARLDRRDPRLGFTQRLGACMHGVGAQDKVVIMRDSRAEYELGIGSGLEFDRGVRRPEGHQL